ncbi:MAG: hypothetical protein A3A33_03400 [Candidatus Yanofskybacteria bacterium RIFCSPLOWO2_01_FULL_49_25]|uniref:Bacterial type II secretion system protein E domain-containing protein n=1 Tax=Candidatus Yanofskybacteria bacterium RIFCSPLOWO2_01_FULL_49_25 TaxID=1802701 RepID=A0A1F8GUY7_9BACT|nr:MAG: hypothetical protein A3A33_03400 [Candidatus Yanofskybacteria bacterium RIFCSPLOWO2_01_FULL_49_25]
MLSQTPQLLVDALIQRGLVTSDIVADLEQEASSKEKDFGEVIVQRGIISDEELARIKSELYHLPILDAAGVQIPSDISKIVSDSTVNLYRVIPYAKDGDVLKVALVNPENIDALQALKFIASEQNLTLEKSIVGYTDFERLGRSFLSLSSEVGKALESIASDSTDKKELRISEKETDLKEITAEAPVTKIVAAIIKHAVETRTSDIHIEPHGEEIRLRFRVDGSLQTALSLPGNLLSALVTRIKILSELKIDETRLAQDGRFSTKFNDRTIDFRVSTFPTRTGEKVVLRILDPFVGDITLNDLGVEGRSLQLIKENIAKPFGSILITGPTGSGKSTTLAAILRMMNNEEINIVTLEDPIEYYVEGVNQSQIHEEIGYTFANGLRHILRQDPDVIMVGEIRDAETAGLATQAALTGHIVLSTLHTNNTIGVIPRLVDMGVEKYLIAPSLNLAAAQRLVRQLCTACRVKTAISESERDLIVQALKRMPKAALEGFPAQVAELYKAGPGCKECNGKAYKGRIAIFETLAMTDELERIILTGLSEEKLRAEAMRQGMITMFQDGIIKVLRGATSLEELLQVAQEADAEDA